MEPPGFGEREERERERGGGDENLKLVLANLISPREKNSFEREGGDGCTEKGVESCCIYSEIDVRVFKDANIQHNKGIHFPPRSHFSKEFTFFRSPV